jgi:hypothetical protein
MPRPLAALLMNALEKAFDFAQETTKQVLTLSSGIIAITVTFLNGDLKTYPQSTRQLLEIGWALYLASILFGIVTLMALAGNLERPNQPNKQPSIYARNIVVPSILQLLTFLAAVALTAAFGWKAG